MDGNASANVHQIMTKSARGHARFRVEFKAGDQSMDAWHQFARIWLAAGQPPPARAE
jgi:hypothetical protein